MAYGKATQLLSLIHIYLIIVCLLSGLSLPVCGQSTLDDCIRYAWKHNPGFKNVQIDVKEARTDYVAAMGKFLPYVSVQAEVGRHIAVSYTHLDVYKRQGIQIIHWKYIKTSDMRIIVTVCLDSK